MPGTGGTAFNAGLLSGQGQGLGSVAAQQGFARGVAIEQHGHAQSLSENLGGGMGATKPGALGRIREVWRYNLEQEFAVLRQLILKYPYVSMDAEFPGIVARPIGNFAHSKAEYHYQTLRCNVDILKPIQVGITLWTSEGELPPAQPTPDLFNRNMPGSKNLFPPNALLMSVPCTWVFNFHFDLNEDMYAETSIELLKTSGVDFNRHFEMGIIPEKFGSLLTTSGLAFSPDVHWLSFHSGYDFGYLIKLLTDAALPEDQTLFFDQVATFFPKLWDIKFLLRDAQRQRTQNRLPTSEGARILDNLGTKSGLQDLADELGCQRIGASHTGGSDAWLTGSVFWAMRGKIFGGSLDDQLADQIYGLHGVAAPASQQYRDEFLAAIGTPQGQSLHPGSQQGGHGVNGAGGVGGVHHGLGAANAFTPANHPSTPTSSHVGLHSSQTPGPGGHFGQGQQGGPQGGAFGAFGGYGK